MMPDPFDYAAHGLRPSRPGSPRADGLFTIPMALRRAVSRQPKLTAVVGRAGRLTYEELLAVVSGAAAKMQVAGVRRFDRVGASLSNDLDIVVAFLATMEIGAIWTGVPRVLSAPEKAHILGNAGVRLFWTDAATAQQLVPHRAALPALEHIWTDAASNSSRAGPRDVSGLDPYAPAIMAFTSGTTGFPKGAVHSQYNALLPGYVSLGIGALKQGDAIGAVLPLTIANLMVLGPVSAIQGEATLVCIDRTDPEGLAEWISGENVVQLSGVPTIYHDLIERPDLFERFRSLRLPETGGAEMSETMRGDFRKLFGCELHIGYGMTEAPTRVTWTYGVPDLPAQSCGRPCAQVAIEILGPDGNSMPPGEVGEICVRPVTAGPFAGQYAFFLGYWNNAAATNEALKNGMLHTGDLGSVDEVQNVFIRGRKKELILRGGANVYPAEIERVLMSDARLQDCAVLGRPDKRLGEKVVAFVRRRADQFVTEGELRELCDRNLARYKIPSEFYFVTEFPRNAMGKILKAELSKMFVDTQ
jgi:long-chain acyl-CoA synthetase